MGLEDINSNINISVTGSRESATEINQVSGSLESLATSATPASNSLKTLTKAQLESIAVSKLQASQLEILSKQSLKNLQAATPVSLTKQAEQTSPALAALIANNPPLSVTGSIDTGASATDINTSVKAMKELNKETKENVKDSKEAEEAALTLGGKVRLLNKDFNNLRWTMVNVGYAFGILATVLTPLAILTKYGMELETVFTRISIVTGKAASDITESMHNIRKGTMFGLKETADAFLTFSKAGFSAGEATLAIKPIMTLATVGFTDMGTASKIVAQVLHEFNLTAAQAGDVVSILAAAANKSAADVETFASALSYVGPMAEQLGISFQETAAGISLLSNAGLTASKAGTSMTAMLTSLVNSSKAGQQEIKNLGVTLFDAQGDFIGIDNMIKEFNAALAGMTSEEKLKALSEIFETRGARAVMTYMNAYKENGDTIKNFEDDITDATYAVEALSKVQDTAAAQSKKAAEDFKAAWGPISLWLAETVTGALEVVNAEVINFGSESRIKKLKDIGIDTTALEKDASKLKNTLGENFAVGLANTYGMGGATQGIISSTKILDAQNFDKRMQLAEQAAEIMNIVTDAAKQGAVDLKTVVPETDMTLKQFIDTIASGNIYTDEFYNKIDFLADYMGKVKTPAQRATAALKEFKKLTATDSRISTSGVSLDLTEKQRETYNQILNTTEDVTKMDLKRINLLEDMVRALREQDTLLASQATNLLGALNQIDGLLASFGEEGLNKFDKEFKSVIDGIVVQVTRLREKAGANELADDYNSVVEKVLANSDAYKVLDSSLEGFNDSLKEEQANLKRLNADLDEQSEKLSKYKDSLAKVNDAISKLSNPRFTGQTQVEQLMSKVETYQKKQRLATYGITDAFAFLQQAVKMTEAEYDNFFKTVVKTNDATKDSKNDYDAWRETVKTFIEESITTGNQLSQSVTQAVGKYKNLLLSTNKFDDATDSSSDTISLLRDAYDVHYGAMTDDVKYAIQAHDEEADGVYSSSQQVIAALQANWIEQNRWTASIIATENEILILKAKIDVAEDSITSIKDSIDDATDSMLELVDATRLLLKDLYELNKQKIIDIEEPKKKKYSSPELEEVFKLPDNYGTDQETIDWFKEFGGQDTGWVSPFNSNGGLIEDRFSTIQTIPQMQEPIYIEPDQDWLLTGLDYLNNTIKDTFSFLPFFNDFIMRPGEEPISFSPNDTIIGTKGGIDGGGVIIENISISGVSGDAEDFAYRFAQELRRELRNV